LEKFKKEYNPEDIFNSILSIRQRGKVWEVAKLKK